MEVGGYGASLVRILGRLRWRACGVELGAKKAVKAFDEDIKYKVYA